MLLQSNLVSYDKPKLTSFINQNTITSVVLKLPSEIIYNRRIEPDFPCHIFSILNKLLWEMRIELHWQQSNTVSLYVHCKQFKTNFQKHIKALKNQSVSLSNAVKISTLIYPQQLHNQGQRRRAVEIPDYLSLPPPIPQPKI